MATTDLHVHILPFDYYEDAASETVGLSRVADLVAVRRNEVPNTLLFDNGDFLQGSALGDLVARKGLARGEVHPMVAAMNALGYDAGNLGNHEFSHGLPFLLRSMSDFAFPVLSANAEVIGGGMLVRPWVILDRHVEDLGGHRHRLRIGVIGFLPPQTEVWDSDHLSGRLRTTNILAAADRHLADLRAEGADLVVALCHEGIEAAPDGAERTAAARALAARGDIDAIIAGHTHLVFPDPQHPGGDGIDTATGMIFGKPAVLAGAMGSHLGVIDLSLERPDGGGWRVVGSEARVDVVRKEPPSKAGKAVRRAARAAHRATRVALNSQLGWSDIALDTHFATVAECAANLLMAEAKRDHVRDRLDPARLGGLPILATTSVYRAGGRGGPGNYFRLEPGAVTERHVSSLSPFPNRICALRMTVAELLPWLEDAASAFRTIRPGSCDQPLMDPGIPPYRFFGLLGASYVVDVSAPPGGGRVRDLRIGGEVPEPGTQVIVATGSYRAALLEAGPLGARVARLPIPGQEDLRDVVAAWIRRKGRIVAQPVDGWRLVLPAGASVVFDTAPDAVPGRAKLPGLKAERLGLTAEGFQRVRITPLIDGGQRPPERA